MSTQEQTSGSSSAVEWPRRFGLFGVRVSDTSYDQAVEAIMAAARRRLGAVVTHLPVHGVVEAAIHRELREQVNDFDIIAADGHPVRWAMNWFRGTSMRDRVYGPELMLRLCGRAAAEGVGVYLYGGAPAVVKRLAENLRERFAELQIVGVESPPFRALSEEEERAAVGRINQSGAGLVFLGLGCPLQDRVAHRRRKLVRAVQLCVGAAFDFHAGSKRMAPGWMQSRGLEWLYRLMQEPRRLMRRYLVTNTIFLGLCARETLTRLAMSDGQVAGR